MPKRENIIKQTTNTLTVELYVEIHEEDGYFVAYCPALELSSYGTDEVTAKKRFEKEVEIFFVEASQKGTLEKYLLKMGWTLRKKPVPKYTPPKFTAPKQIRRTSFTEDVAIPVC
ncbi:hypothetical protein ACE01N_10115 [Saccharicrinis sp. FJH2]|uniref:hypothetical protein n=1 Tax=Saccharicrinis sp. FJH65 TaxID=3344659 RepID=UPI0035F3554A